MNGYEIEKSTSTSVMASVRHADETVEKQPWHRPTVSFVPMQVTAAAKSANSADGPGSGSN